MGLYYLSTFLLTFEKIRGPHLLELMEYESNMADVASVALMLLLVDVGELESTRKHRRHDMYLM